MNDILHGIDIASTTDQQETASSAEASTNCARVLRRTEVALRSWLSLIVPLALLVAVVPTVRAASQEQDRQASPGVSRSEGRQPNGAASLIEHKDKHPVSHGPKKSHDRVQLQSRLVNSTLTVADRSGGYISGLTKNDFRVFDN